ncbi:MAG: NAD(P)/FAD-dependent oxidoreductase, partial [Gammaproteobacteria bacterium]
MLAGPQHASFAVEGRPSNFSTHSMSRRYPHAQRHTLCAFRMSSIPTEHTMREHLKHAGVEHASIWMHGVDMPVCPSLAEDVDGDVCVIGAGISGLTTAYLLAQEGKSVIVLDDGVIGGGMTHLTTAHLASAIDDRYVEMERLHGEKGARLAAQSHAAAIDRIEDIVQKENIACDFTRLNGYLFLPPGDDPEFLDRELAATRRAGLQGVTKLGRAPLPLFDTGPCLCFPRQGQFHPLKYLAALAAAVMRKGARIFSRTHADHVNGGAPARIKAGRHIVTAKAVIVATNSPVVDRVAIHTKQAPYMTYVIGAKIPRGSVPEGLYWDTADPYHYVRLYKSAGESNRDADDLDTLIVGGEDHKTGQARDTEERHGRLEAWARDRFPDIEAIEFAWSGQV